MATDDVDDDLEEISRNREKAFNLLCSMKVENEDISDLLKIKQEIEGEILKFDGRVDDDLDSMVDVNMKVRVVNDCEEKGREVYFENRSPQNDQSVHSDKIEVLKNGDANSYVYPDLIRNQRKLMNVRIYDITVPFKRVEQFKAEVFFSLLTNFVKQSMNINFIEFFDVRYENGAFFLKMQTFRNYHWLRTVMSREFASFNLRAELASGKKVTLIIPADTRRHKTYELLKIIYMCSQIKVNFSQWFLKSSKFIRGNTFYNFYVQNMSLHSLYRLIRNLRYFDKLITVIISH